MLYDGFSSTRICLLPTSSVSLSNHPGFRFSNKAPNLVLTFGNRYVTDLRRLRPPPYKVASTDTTNIPFLLKIAATGKPILLSTGMCYAEEVEKVVELIRPINQNLILLQCTATAVQVQYRGALLLYNTLLVHYCTAVHYQYNTTVVCCYYCEVLLYTALRLRHSDDKISVLLAVLLILRVVSRL